MALTQMTLAAAVAAGDLTLTFNAPSVGSLPSVGLVTPAWPLRIDSEYMFLVQMLSATVGKVRSRGAEATYAVAHDVLAQCQTSATAADFPTPSSPLITQNEPTVDNTVNVGQDQTIAIPSVSTTYYINKASACAITLANGLPTQQGVEMTFIAMTGFAHTVTYAPGFNANTTSSDVATFNAVGGCLVVEVTNTGTLVANSTNAGVTIA